ncbi:MAG: hypothetical protein ACXQT1_03550 [Methermicoccaceae archaeon]
MSSERVHIQGLVSFPYSVQKYAIRDVPETVINEELELVSMVRRSEVAKKLKKMLRA